MEKRLRDRIAMIEANEYQKSIKAARAEDDRREEEVFYPLFRSIFAVWRIPAQSRNSHLLCDKQQTTSFRVVGGDGTPLPRQLHFGSPRKGLK